MFLKKNNQITLLLVGLVATLCSSLTLWLFDSWLKYPFFALEIFSVIILFLIVTGHDFSSNLITRLKVSHRINSWISVFLIVASVILLILNILDTQSSPIQLILALTSYFHSSWLCIA